eukprot:TRINITY_DN5935_c0_g1_i4.p1 TRINITY_DN5935_c0_g1~~TRINITY_DN5935_c0_g1_i4.p1  ORF type:complete len:1235 (+),score=382.61 TRINITY_DN5935_c0_g1_i4:315-4019(+)
MELHDLAARGERKQLSQFVNRKDNKSLIDKKNGAGLTALHLAAANGFKDSVEILIDAGASLNIKDRSQARTALHLAALNNHLSTVLLLLSKGAQTELLDKKGFAPLDLLFDGYRSSLKSLTESKSSHLMIKELFTWGLGINLQLGHGLTENKTQKRVRGVGSQVESVSCSEFHTAAITDEGDLWAWGYGRGGRLGLGTESSQIDPQRVMTLDDRIISQVSTSAGHTACVTSEGHLFTFGDNAQGQLGLGDTESVSHPRRVRGILDSKKIVYVACGKSHTACITSSGELFTFGYGGEGALGHGVMNSQLAPREVSSLKASNVSLMCVGSQHTVVSDSSDVFVFGFGKPYARRVVIQTPSRKRPKITCLAASSTGVKSLAVCDSGECFVWSFDGKDAPTKQNEKPVNFKPRMVTLPNSRRIVKAALCGDQKLLLLSSEGEVFECEDTGKEPRPVRVPELKRVVEIAASRDHCAAITADFLPQQHGASIGASLQPWINNTTFSDFLFEVEGGAKIAAHKIILAVRCPYFAKYFGSHQTEQFMKLENTSSTAIMSVLSLLYADEVIIPEDKEVLEQVYKLSQRFHLGKLAFQANLELMHRNKLENSALSVQESFCEEFKKDEPSEYLTDVHLLVENSVIKAHKIILASRSDFFKYMLTSGMKESFGETSTVAIEDVRGSTMKRILSIIYTGEFPKMAAQELADVFVAADRLFLTDIKETCEECLIDHVEDETAVSLLEAADLLQATSLRKACVSYIVSNLRSVLLSNQMDELSQEITDEIQVELKKRLSEAPEEKTATSDGSDDGERSNDTEDVSDVATAEKQQTGELQEIQSGIPVQTGEAQDPAKRFRFLKKKIAQIEYLEKIKQNGETLNEEQLAKIDSKIIVQDELEVLKLQHPEIFARQSQAGEETSADERAPKKRNRRGSKAAQPVAETPKEIIQPEPVVQETFCIPPGKEEIADSPPKLVNSAWCATPPKKETSLRSLLEIQNEQQKLTPGKAKHSEKSISPRNSNVDIPFLKQTPQKKGKQEEKAATPQKNTPPQSQPQKAATPAWNIPKQNAISLKDIQQQEARKPPQKTGATPPRLASTPPGLSVTPPGLGATPPKTSFLASTPPRTGPTTPAKTPTKAANAPPQRGAVSPAYQQERRQESKSPWANKPAIFVPPKNSPPKMSLKDILSEEQAIQLQKNHKVQARPLKDIIKEEREDQELRDIWEQFGDEAAHAMAMQIWLDERNKSQ